MGVPFRLVDVFGERPFTGNQLCVVTDPIDLDAAGMQMLAREIGFSETTFVTEAVDDRYAMRVFTPVGELPFAGHPTLGTAFVLATDGRIGEHATQSVPAGEFAVEVDLEAGTALVHQHPPEFGAEADATDLPMVGLGAGLSVADLHPVMRPQVVSTGLAHLMVPAASVSAVEHAQPDANHLHRVTRRFGCDGYYLFALTDEGAKARLFAPEVGVSEDPATGSAAGPLSAYLAVREIHSDPLTIRQGAEMGRPSVIEACARRDGGAWDVTVEGRVWIVGGGSFDV